MTKNDTEARAKREIAEEHPYPLSLLSDMPLRLYSALVAERVKNLELRERVDQLDAKRGDLLALIASFVSGKSMFLAACTAHDLIDICSCNGCTLYRIIARAEKALQEAVSR